MNIRGSHTPETGRRTPDTGPEQAPPTSLESQARDIIHTILAEADPQAAPARNRLRSLLADNPEDHITVLREHLILTRTLARTHPTEHPSITTAG